MAKIVFAMNMSLDGYVDHEKFGPDPVLFRHWIDAVQASSGSLYGRRLYEIMAYWDEDDSGWHADMHAFAEAWRAQRKWVVSKTMTSAGPNATIVTDDLGTFARKLKEELDGEIDVGGPRLAHGLAGLGLIDEYRLYLHPVVLGNGTPFFAGPRPPLRLAGSERIGPEVIRLTYVPA